MKKLYVPSAALYKKIRQLKHHQGSKNYATFLSERRIEREMKMKIEMMGIE